MPPDTVVGRSVQAVAPSSSVEITACWPVGGLALGAGKVNDAGGSNVVPLGPKSYILPCMVLGAGVPAAGAPLGTVTIVSLASELPGMANVAPPSATVPPAAAVTMTAVISVLTVGVVLPPQLATRET